MFGRHKPVTTDDFFDDEGYLCHDMKELVKQIRNRCEYLLNSEQEWLHPETLIEDNYEDCQKLLEYCVEEDA